MIPYLGQIQYFFAQGAAHIRHILLSVLLHLGCFAESVVHFGQAQRGQPQCLYLDACVVPDEGYQTPLWELKILWYPPPTTRIKVAKNG
jgi:hypothetical protein